MHEVLIQEARELEALSSLVITSPVGGGGRVRGIRRPPVRSSVAGSLHGSHWWSTGLGSNKAALGAGKSGAALRAVERQGKRSTLYAHSRALRVG